MLGRLSLQRGGDAAERLILAGLHRGSPQRQAASAPSRGGGFLRRAAESAAAGDAPGCSLSACREVLRYRSSAWAHSSLIGRSSIWRICGGSVTRILATLMLNTESRSVSKSSAARASFVCSSMPRIPFQPPHWTSRSAR